MLRYLKFTLFCLNVFFLPISGFADDAQNSNPPELPIPPQALTCPAPNTLKFDSTTHLWGAPGKWKSFDTSFSNEIAGFLGAQWMGVKIGKLTCIYRPNDKMTFPITLQYADLTFLPPATIDKNHYRLNKWGKNLGGYNNCISKEILDCYFIPRAKPQAKDVNQEATQLYDPDQPASRGFGF